MIGTLITLIILCVCVFSISFGISMLSPTLAIPFIGTDKPKKIYNILKNGEDENIIKDVPPTCNWSGYHCWDGVLKKCVNGQEIVEDAMECGYPKVCDPINSEKCMVPDEECLADGKFCSDNLLYECMNGKKSLVEQCIFGCDPSNLICKSSYDAKVTNVPACGTSGYTCLNGVLRQCANGNVDANIPCGYPGLCDPTDPTKCVEPDPICRNDGPICSNDSLYKCTKGKQSLVAKCKHGCDQQSASCKPECIWNGSKYDANSNQITVCQNGKKMSVQECTNGYNSNENNCKSIGYRISFINNGVPMYFVAYKTTRTSRHGEKYIFRGIKTTANKGEASIFQIDYDSVIGASLVTTVFESVKYYLLGNKGETREAYLDVRVPLTGQFGVKWFKRDNNTALLGVDATPGTKLVSNAWGLVTSTVAPIQEGSTVIYTEGGRIPEVTWSPLVDPEYPLAPEHEATVRRYYGINIEPAYPPVTYFPAEERDCILSCDRDAIELARRYYNTHGQNVGKYAMNPIGQPIQIDDNVCEIQYKLSRLQKDLPNKNDEIHSSKFEYEPNRKCEWRISKIN